MRLTSMMACAVLALGLFAWIGCDNADDARTGNDTNNTAPDARTAGERTPPTDTGTTGARTGTDTATGADTTGTSGAGTASPTTAPSDTTGGTGTSGAGSPR